MPTYDNSRLPPPKSWDEFESIVCSAAKNRWKNPDFTRHGRQGQRQDGVDVYGNDSDGKLVGLQCKNTVSDLSVDTIKEEVEKAESFKPALTYLYVATTAETDKKTQALVRELSEERKAAGKFGVLALFWGDICNDLTLDESRLYQHYPQLKPKTAEQQPTHDQRLYEELKKVFGYEPAVRLLRDQDFGAAFPKVAIQPLYDFYETWDQPEKEFIDPELQAGLVTLYRAAAVMATHLVEKTVPVGTGIYLSVFSDNQRAEGPRPPWVIEEARVLNEQASLFVPIYENFMRLCRDKLVR